MTDSTGLSARAPWRMGLISALLASTLSACGGGGTDPTTGSGAPPPADLAGGGSGNGTGDTSTPTNPDDPNAALAPDPVSTLQASIEDRRFVVLDWPASSRATRYDLYWSPIAGVDQQTAQRIANVIAPFTHTEVEGGLQYHYIVTATNAAGTSAPSTEVTVTLPPAAVQGLSLTTGDTVLDLSWSGATGATRYRVYWSNDPGTVLQSGQVIEVDVPSLTHSGLQNGTAYHYRVSAVGSGGEGPVSAQLAGQPETPVPGAPGSFSIAIHPDDSRSVILSWDAPQQPVRPEDILLYNVYRFSSTEIATVVAQTYSGLFIDTPPVAGVPWSYRVSAVTVAGEGPTSATISITTSSSNGEDSGDPSQIPDGVFDCGEPTECWAPQ